MDSLSPELAGFLASIIAGLATGLGAIPIVMRKSWPQRDISLMLSCAAGIMLAATFFSLLAPGIEMGIEQGGKLSAIIISAFGMTLGVGLIWTLHKYLPHEHPMLGREGGESGTLSRPMLLALAIALHNIPEGLSVGVAFSGTESHAGLALAFGIALQNMPEGLAVAAAMVDLGVSRWRAFWIALASGIVEPAAAVLGIGVISITQNLVPWALTFAAGAMLYVVCGEVIPESYEDTGSQRPILALSAGFIGMMIIAIIFS